MAEDRQDPIFPVGFDEDALAEDLERLPDSAGEALDAFRKELHRQGGLPKSRLKACHDEAQDGTMLGGCVKTYVPWPDGRFGAVFVAVTHPNRPMALRAFAFGVRHHPPESNAETVYEVAHRRLNDRASS
jgi:hypothetical protein